jgi:formaldehyde-activating enzyme involved in methanogenesis
VLGAYPVPLAATGTDTNAAVDTQTGPNTDLLIRALPGASFTTISVTSGLAVPKTTIRDDLNTAFALNGLPFSASVVGTNQLRITSTVAGPAAYLEIDTNVLSTLNDVVGYAAGGVVLAGSSYAALLAAVQAAVYPAPTTIDVSAATIVGSDPGFALLSAPDQAALAAAVADLVAPQLVETGLVELSFVQGILSELIDPTFQPGGARAGLPAGVAAAVVENDGVTPYTYP